MRSRVGPINPSHDLSASEPRFSTLPPASPLEHASIRHMQDQSFRGLLVGLGNPGREYQCTPHNMGFLALDAFFESASPQWLQAGSPIRNCELWRSELAGERWLAVKPLTYMNRSGDVVGPLSRWYRIPPEQVLVVHDELDLQPGMLRFKMGGGAAGHKGILSVTEALGTNAFPRLRLGIGRPPAGSDPAAYVLRSISQESMPVFSEALKQAARALTAFCTKGLAAATQELHSAQRQSPQAESNRTSTVS